jgi:hypothetical protein
MRAAKIDGNHTLLMNELKARGWRVVSTARMGGGFPDVLIWRANRGYRLVEIKQPKGTLTPDQREFHAAFPVDVLRSLEDVASLCRLRCGWREDEDGNWTTDCGRVWTFIDGNPADNRAHYCMGCALPIEAIEYREEE